MAKRVVNGHKQNGSRLSALSLARMVRNEQTSMSRASLMAMAYQLPPIDINSECRYPKTLTIDHYQEMYDREGVATRVVSVYPEESWAMTPDIYETEDMKKTTPFETAWHDLNERLNLFTHLQTVDEVSGIGNYGVLLLGFDDGNKLDTAVAGLKPDGTLDARYKNRKLLYVRSVPQRFAKIKTFDTNVRSPRYGQPLTYEIGMANPEHLTSLNLPEAVVHESNVEVHWTRVIHIAEGAPVWAVPRLQNVYNYIFNIRKILGANGQGYWAGGFPGISLETPPNMDEGIDFDIATAKEEIDAYLNGLQRYLALENLQAKSLAVQVADPKPHFETQLAAICMTLGIPMRVFKGTEEAKLASSQDMRTWNKRLAKRQLLYIEPFIIRPFLERLFAVGVLPRPKQLLIRWPDLNAPTENDRANTAQKITEAMVKYIAGNVFIIMPPREYLVDVLGFPLVKVDAILSSAGGKKMQAVLDKIVKLATTPPPAPAAGGRTVQKKKANAKTKRAPVDSGAGQSS